MSEEVSCLPKGPERSVVLEHPREHVLTGEKFRLLLVFLGLDACGRPVGHGSVGVTGLVDDGVEGVTGKRREALFDVVQESPGSAGSSNM